MASDFLDITGYFLKMVWHYSPNELYIEASLGINLATGVYKPILETILENTKANYESKVSKFDLIDLQPAQNKTLLKDKTIFLNDLRDGFSEKAVRWATRAAIFMAGVCMFLLYFNINHMLTLILPSTPIVFYFGVKSVLSFKYRRFLSKNEANIAFCKSQNEGLKETTEQQVNAMILPSQNIEQG
jgi:hypothetical protein